MTEFPDVVRDPENPRPGETAMTLAEALDILADDLAATQPTPELDSDGNRIGPDNPAEWDGMDCDPPMVMVDLEAAWMVLDALREDPLEDPKHRGPAYQRGYRDGVLARRAGITDPEVPRDA